MSTKIAVILSRKNCAFKAGRLAFFIALAGSALLASVSAQTPALSKSVTIDVTDQTGNSATVNSWRNVYGSVSRTKAVSRELTIMVRNMSAAPGEFQVEWYFVGRAAGGSRRFLYDKGEKSISIKPGSFEKFAVESKELSNYRYHSAFGGYTYKSGDKADGWIIRVKAGGEVVRVKASNVQLEEIEKDKAQFEKFVGAMRKSS